MHRPGRRAVLASVAAALAGCLHTDDASTDADTTQSDRPDTDEPAAQDDAEQPADGTGGSEGPDGEVTEGRRGDDTEEPDGDGEPHPDGDDGEELDGAGEDVFSGYELTDVTVQTPDGEALGWVRAAVADTPELRYTGLSDTDELPEGYGMLFVFDDVDDRTFVMREMDFGIDIVYADDRGTITEIHHAPEPDPDEDGETHRYPGHGQYVLEVAYRWSADRGVEEGDVLAFDR